jgi:dimethylhistidine N-methyltransferase
LSADPAGAGRRSPIADAVARGLSSPRKRLSPFLFYDARGSQLFEAITELPEYYPTRTERAIFVSRADAIVAATRRQAHAPSLVLELGAGTANKSQILLAAFVRQQGKTVFLPVDVSPEPLRQCTERLGRELPEALVEPIVDRHEGALSLLAARPGHRVVLFIGSSIGNLDDDEARALLTRVRQAMQPGDAFVLGADRRKDLPTMIAAYDDAAGVTAAFNRNVLARINRELGGHFDLARFAHRAVWNNSSSCIEMHLVSDRAQRVRIDALGIEIAFEEGETIHTESSAKYDDERIARILGASGFAEAERFLDDRGWFGVHVALAV